jgi:hypothetical protein
MVRKKSETLTQELPPSEPAASPEPTPPEPIGVPVAEVIQQVAEQQKVYPKHRGWAHNNLAGVELSFFASKEEPKLFEARIQFRDGDPGAEVRQYMKENGFQWHRDREAGLNFGKEGAWTFPIGYMTGHENRLNAERVYFHVVEQLLKAKGLTPEPQAAR